MMTTVMMMTMNNEHCLEVHLYISKFLSHPPSPNSILSDIVSHLPHLKDPQPTHRSLGNEAVLIEEGDSGSRTLRLGRNSPSIPYPPSRTASLFPDMPTF